MNQLMPTLAAPSRRLDRVLPLPVLGNASRKIDGAAARFGRVAGRQGRWSNDNRVRPPSCPSGCLTAWGCTTSSWTRTQSSVSRLSTTAYAGVAGDGTLGLEKLSFRLPLVATLPKSQRVVQIDAFRESDWPRGMDLMNQVIREGKSWPFEDEFATMDAYRAYFLSHLALCVRDPVVHNPADRRPAPPMLGCFYVKPNFPGRCSHVCNGGFVTAPEAREQGVAKFMGRAYLQVAKDVGYRSSYFNLVFANNAASVRLWESLGFERVAVLPKAARTRRGDDDGDDDDEGGGLETAYGYWYDLDALPSNYLSQFVTIPET